MDCLFVYDRLDYIFSSLMLLVDNKGHFSFFKQQLN